MNQRLLMSTFVGMLSARASYALRVLVANLGPLLMLALPIPGEAQEHLERATDQQAAVKRHHHYKLIDIGTFGGPQSFVNPGSGNETGNYAMVLNSGGSVTGWAETSTPDPFPAFCFSDDCVIAHTFVWKNGAKLDMGALPGGASSAGNWISTNGLIAGFSQNGETDPLIPGVPEARATLWAHGRIIDLGILPEGGFESIAAAVNSKGQVVGLATNAIPDPNSMVGTGFQTRAFIWQNGAMEDLGTLGTGTDAQAILINEPGQVVGWSYTGTAPSAQPLCPFPLTTGSFVWEKGKGMQDLGSFGGTCTVAFDLNDRGQIVGESTLSGDQAAHAFLWDNGVVHDLGGSLGGSFTGAFAINQSGRAVGFALLPGDTIFHAALWTRIGQLTDLGVIGADQCSMADSINAQMQVVGSSSPDCFAMNVRAFLWEDGTMFDLNALIPSDSALYLQFTETINSRGEIAGTGSDVHGNTHAFLLIPCDEGHPDIEGCDYSLVDAKTATAAQAAGGTRDSKLSAAGEARGPMSSTRALPAARESTPVRQLLLRRLGFGRITASVFQVPSDAAGTSGPGATLSPGSLTFSTLAVGTTSATDTVTLKNTGTTSLSISSIAITGIDGSDFAQTHTCGSSLAAGASCSISVTFRPTASGTRTAILSATDNVPGSPQKVSLTGIGTTAKVSPTSLNFGTVAIGVTSPVHAVTLTNVGTTTLTANGISITGTNAADFAQTHNCASSLAAGASCSISVIFKPTASGTRAAILSVTDNAAGSPQKVSVTGTGTTAQLSPVSLNFGTVTIGVTTPAHTVRLTNVGTATLTVSGIAITGSNAGDFAQTHTCGSSLAAKASCSISVTFKPTVAGTRTAMLSATDNATASPQTVSLAGTGTTATPDATLSAASLIFGTQLVGTTSPAQSITLTNNSAVALFIGSISSMTHFAETNNCLPTVASGSSCTISVTFTPGGSGAVSGTLSISDDAAGSPQRVSLSGTGATMTPLLNGYCFATCRGRVQSAACPAGQEAKTPDFASVYPCGPVGAEVPVDAARSCPLQGAFGFGHCETAR